MADIVNDLAGRAGIDPQQARKGLGAVLGFLKGKLPAEDFSKVEGAVPGAAEMTAEAEAAPQASGGMLGKLKSAAGGLLGGSGGGGDLLAKLGGLGIPADKIGSFLPAVVDKLSSVLPTGVMEKIRGLIPGMASSAK